jgi:hypothetical protein
MPAATLNITVEQGSHYEIQLTVNDENDDPIDLTGFEFAGQIRAKSSKTESLADFDFEITDAAAGLVRAFIISDDTAAIPVKAPSGELRGSSVYVYDIEYGPAAGERYRLLQGTATVSGEVTRG